MKRNNPAARAAARALDCDEAPVGVRVSPGSARDGVSERNLWGLFLFKDLHLSMGSRPFQDANNRGPHC